MNNMQPNRKDPSFESTTVAKVMAHYCCDCEQNDLAAQSEKVTTKLVPVQVSITTPSCRIHPGSCFSLTVTVQNNASCTICSPKLQFSACQGVHICNVPTVGDIPAGGVQNITVTVKVDQNVGCSCSIKATLSFMHDGCCCKATSGEWITVVSRSIPGLQIQKSISPACCITPGEVLCVTIQVANTGNIQLSDVCITDELPAMTSYVPNSTRICGMTAIDKNPQNGIVLNCLKPKEQVIITYRLLVEEMNGACSCDR